MVFDPRFESIIDGLQKQDIVFVVLFHCLPSLRIVVHTLDPKFMAFVFMLLSYTKGLCYQLEVASKGGRGVGQGCLS